MMTSCTHADTIITVSSNLEKTDLVSGLFLSNLIPNRMYVRRPVFGVPFGGGNKVAIIVGGWAGRWVYLGLVGFAGFDGGLHLVVDVEDGEFGAVVAVGFDVFLFDDGEGFHDVFDGVPRRGEHVDELG